MHPGKHEIRTQLKALLRKNLPLASLKSLQLCHSIQQHPLWKTATTVAVFAPLPGEPDLLSLCPSPDKRLFFPKISKQDLLWLEVDNPHTQLSQRIEGNMRLQEPHTPSRIDISKIDLLLVPGLAFSTEGARLGRGGGFYDRALSQKASTTRTMGVCFDFQICENIPTEPHDQLVDGLFYV